MQRNHCNCSVSSRQRIAECLNQDTLPLDKILQAGSEFTAHLNATINCERCITTKRLSHTLSQMTVRLVCFYEAATNLASATNVRPTSDANSPPASPLSPNSHTSSSARSTMQRPTGCQSVSLEKKLGELCIDGQEGRLLIKVALVDACLDLNEKIQRCKATTNELWEAVDEQYLVHYNRVIGHCLDRLAKMIGLLQLDGLSVEQS